MLKKARQEAKRPVVNGNEKLSWKVGARCQGLMGRQEGQYGVVCAFIYYFLAFMYTWRFVYTVPCLSSLNLQLSLFFFLDFTRLKVSEYRSCLDL